MCSNNNSRPLSLQATPGNSTVISINGSKELGDLLGESGDKLVVIAFLDWSLTSKKAADNVKKLAIILADSVIFATVDVQKHEGIAQEYHAKTYPVCFLVKKFEQLAIVNGKDYDILEREVKKYM